MNFIGFEMFCRQIFKEADIDSSGTVDTTEVQVMVLLLYVRWAANKRFEVLKLNFKFPRARTFEPYSARFRLYRSQILQVNTR